MAEDGTAVCYIFDLVEVPPVDQPEMVAVLAALLQEEGVQKVLHDGRRDAEALLYQLGISIAAPVLDTQVTCLSYIPYFAELWVRGKCTHIYIYVAAESANCYSVPSTFGFAPPICIYEMQLLRGYQISILLEAMISRNKDSSPYLWICIRTPYLPRNLLPSSLLPEADAVLTGGVRNAAAGTEHLSSAQWPHGAHRAQPPPESLWAESRG